MKNKEDESVDRTQVKLKVRKQITRRRSNGSINSILRNI